MKNKKGMLLTEETLKMVIAVIGLALLVYLLFSLYYSGTSEEKQRKAQATIEQISQAMPEGEVLGLQPFGWTLFSFIEDKKPNSCSNENCLCICRKVVADLFSKQIKECDNHGACLVVSNLKEFEKIKIEKELTNIDIKEINSRIEITLK